MRSSTGDCYWLRSDELEFASVITTLKIIGLSEMPSLIVVAYAVAPGPGGPEGHVNARFLRALARYWPSQVTVITAGDSPNHDADTLLSELPNWRFHTLGECGDLGHELSTYNQLALRGLRTFREKKAWSIFAKVNNRLSYWKTGQSLKATSWEVAATRVLRKELSINPDSIVYSRALPFTSVAAVAPLRRSKGFRWIVNINDPMPPALLPGLYQFERWTNRRINSRFKKMLPLIDAFTFPCQNLRRIQLESFPEMSRVPIPIFPHITKRIHSNQSGRAHSRDTNKSLNIVFSGTMRKNRVREELRSGLEEFTRMAPELAKRTILSFHLARPNPYAQQFIAGLPITTRMTIGMFDDDLDQALLEADVLLDIESEPDKHLLLTKVVNYQGFEKPIWAICEPGGTTWNLIDQNGSGYVTRIGDRGGIVKTLNQIHAEWTAGTLLQRKPSKELVGRFSAKRQVEDLLKLCEYLRADTTHPHEITHPFLLATESI